MIALGAIPICDSSSLQTSDFASTTHKRIDSINPPDDNDDTVGFDKCSNEGGNEYNNDGGNEGSEGYADSD